MIRRQPYRQTAKFAIGFSGAALLLKLLVLLHPNMPIGDALFHAHRFHEVLDGRWYFTSIAPGNYRFPYAPGLYVFAIPFAGLVRRGAADMTVLRTIVCVADVLAGLLLYSLTTRIRGDRLSGAVAVALYQLVPLGFGVITVGNLTNAFAQALAIAGLALIASPTLRFERRAMVAALVLTLGVASVFALGWITGSNRTTPTATITPTPTVTRTPILSPTPLPTMTILPTLSLPIAPTYTPWPTNTPGPNG